MESNEQAAGKLPWELAEIFSFKLERDRSHTAEETANPNHASDDCKYLRWSSSLVTAAFGQSFKLCLFVRMFLVFFGQILIRLDRQMMLSGYCWIHVATDSGVYVSTYFLDYMDLYVGQEF